jgi:hypothetical protein
VLIVLAVLLLLLAAALGAKYYFTAKQHRNDGGVPAAERYNAAPLITTNPTFTINTDELARTGIVIATATTTQIQYLIPMVEQAPGEYMEAVTRNEDYTYAPPFQPPPDPRLEGNGLEQLDAADYAEVYEPTSGGASGGGGGAVRDDAVQRTRFDLDPDGYMAGGAIPPTTNKSTKPKKKNTHKNVNGVDLDADGYMAGGEMVRAGADDAAYADADVGYHANADQFGAAAAATGGGGQQGGGAGGGSAAMYGCNTSAVYGDAGGSTSVQYAIAIDYAAQGVYDDAAQAPVDYSAAAGVYGDDAAYAPTSDQSNQSVA